MSLSEVAGAFLEPQVIVAFVTFVVAPFVSVLIAAKREPDVPGVSNGNGAKPSASDRRIRKGDGAMIEAFAQWSERQHQEISKLRADVKELRSQIENVRRLNYRLRQHNEVLIQQLVRAGETPFPAPGGDPSGN